jgi:cytidylate kinase
MFDSKRHSRQTLNEADNSTQEAAPQFWPVVTISRESGSLGLALGRRVAARLGFTFWDQEIVAAVAERLQIDSNQALSLDERAPGRLEVVLTALRVARGGLSTDYCEQLRTVLSSIGHHGGAVIVGRGAHRVILPTHALRVRLVAPVEQRVLDHARSWEISEEVAAQEVAAGDRRRAEFVWRTFHADVTAPADYDLVINVGTYTPLRAESLVLMSYLAKFGELPAEARNTDHTRESGTIALNRDSIGPTAQRTG